MSNRTIAAISTPPGAGGIAVIRISGDDAVFVADKVFRGRRLAEAESLWTCGRSGRERVG